MFFLHMLFALGIGVVVALIFAAGFRRTGPWSNILAFFLIIFLAAWAGGIWLGPCGPVCAGVYWLPFLSVALLVGLLLAAAAPPRRSRGAMEEVTGMEEEAAVEEALDVFFWILIVALLIAVFAGYVFPRPVY